MPVMIMAVPVIAEPVSDAPVTVGAARSGALEPKFVQQMSLEWFFRPCVEPRRLFSRYVPGNLLFPWLASQRPFCSPCADI